MRSDLIHSDLPLWSSSYEGAWPKHLPDRDSIGCASNIRFGDWKLDEQAHDSSWYRISNYGVFHCFLLVGRSFKQNRLAAAKFADSFLIDLGAARSANDTVELWALQMGGRPGSDYILLSRKPDRGIIKSFDVLQRQCPQESVRSGPDLDIIPTSYCAINTPEELVQLARRMAQLPPLGTLTLVKAVSR